MCKFRCQLLASGMTAAALIDHCLRVLSHLHANTQIVCRGIKVCRAKRLNMIATWAMTGLTAHIDLRNTGAVTVADNIEIFLNIVAVTVSAHAVPVFTALRPVYPLAGLCQQLWLWIEPLVSQCIPGYGKLLQAAIGEGHQILLQGFGAKGVENFVLLNLAIGTGQTRIKAIGFF